MTDEHAAKIRPQNPTDGEIEFRLSENPIARHMGEIADTVIYEANNGGFYYVPNKNLPPLSNPGDVCLRALMRTDPDPVTRIIHWLIDDVNVAMQLSRNSDEVVDLKVLTGDDIVLSNEGVDIETIVIFGKMNVH